eukprot:scaffold70722_cov22-Tisochrysis_lutea.AAC.2
MGSLDCSDSHAQQARKANIILAVSHGRHPATESVRVVLAGTQPFSQPGMRWRCAGSPSGQTHTHSVIAYHAGNCSWQTLKGAAPDGLGRFVQRGALCLQLGRMQNHA